VIRVVRTTRPAANGGGHGDSRRRPREILLDDVRNGYVSDHPARSVYRADT
jgi:N-methylhydantoinase B/oxoprolinase/acetone carboxylase alpha subunit